MKIKNGNYTKKNYGKKKKQSAKDAAIDRILIKDGSAEEVAAQGGIQGGSGAIEFFVE